LILLDIHVMAWLATEPDRLSRPAASAIRRARASNGLALADVTLWELAWLCSRGILRAHGTVENTLNYMVTGAGITLRPITSEIAALATQFPAEYPKDPVDRIIDATARGEGMALITHDERIRNCPLLKTIW
jgi:PIN domain nuclease of toxin-antitoxin system